MADTGLFVTLAFWDKAFTENIIYNQLLSDKLRANLGYVYENLVAQMLRASGNELYYYTFPTEKGNTNYEVDFLLSRGNKITPIEVKSSGYKTHKSLDAFCAKCPSRISVRILLYTKDYKKDGATICLPVYFTGFTSSCRVLFFYKFFTYNRKITLLPRSTLTWCCYFMALVNT